TSPNAGWLEAAVAGALGLQLGGDSWYFGDLSSKPVLGDLLYPPVPSHILQANRLILVASILCLFFFTAGYVFLLFLL
ncbi:MAG: cobalamin biosynthesis protein, partial [Deltaproteobacteria bacterium]|nr:cobalamin biosynthesis protein [Deltaproteobacteria bacterium]